MRTRSANPYNEAHGKDLRVYEFIADGSKSASEICDAVETATGLRLRGDPAGQHGFIVTSLRPDGSRFIAIVLYEACADPTHDHPPLVRAADLDAAKQAALKTAVGEHSQHRLDGTTTDELTLRSIGFKDDDAPLRAIR